MFKKSCFSYFFQKIESELESQPLTARLRESKDSQTEEDSVASAPVTQSEFQHIQDKQSVLKHADSKFIGLLLQS